MRGGAVSGTACCEDACAVRMCKATACRCGAMMHGWEHTTQEVGSCWVVVSSSCRVGVKLPWIGSYRCCEGACPVKGIPPLHAGVVL